MRSSAVGRLLSDNPITPLRISQQCFLLPSGLNVLFDLRPLPKHEIDTAHQYACFPGDIVDEIIAAS